MQPAAADLSGDFIRIDPQAGIASGLPLVSTIATDTPRLPPGLCRHWSVRFQNSVERSTEFLFFAPGHSSKGDPVSVTGEVYAEDGGFVQEISVTGAQAFRRSTAKKLDNGVELLADFGSIEWEFPAGIIGSVSAVYEGDGYAVAVPGFCRDGDRDSAARLIVPYFEVEAGPAGDTTLFAARNETDREVAVHAKYFSAMGAMLHEESPHLAPHATRTVNLRDIAPLQGQKTTGFVQIESQEGAVSGDFLLIKAAQVKAGGTLVDGNPDRSPSQLCQSWDVRFLQGEPPGTATDFIFYLDGAPAPGAVATGKVYGEDGQAGKTLTVQIAGSALLVPAAKIDLAGKGSVEWGLPGKGNVAALFRSGGSSMLLPGVCRRSP